MNIKLLHAHCFFFFHNFILQIHNNVLWDWQYFAAILTLGVNTRSILQNNVSPHITRLWVWIMWCLRLQIFVQMKWEVSIMAGGCFDKEMKNRALSFGLRSMRCSRWEPSHEFHFEGLSNFSRSVEGLVQFNPRRQSKNIELKYKIRVELVHGLYGTCFQYNVKR